MTRKLCGEQSLEATQENEETSRLSPCFENRGVKLLQLGIYTEDGAAHDTAGKKIFDITYGVWQKEVERRTLKNTFPAAELLKFKSSSTLRIRFPAGQLEEIAVSGANVFHPNIDNWELSLLHVSLVRRGFSKRRELIPSFYFKVNRSISQPEAGAIAKSVADLIGISKPEIHFREDAWYIFDADYPWVNPFVRADSLPAEADVAKSVEFVCRPAQEKACDQLH
jgi:hypothetical protein